MCSKDGFGKYYLGGCDHEMRIFIGYEIMKEELENCGGYIP